MSDLISRQQAIKDAKSWVAVDEYEKHLKELVIEWLKEFPSAELSTNLASLGTDCISRQAAIRIIKNAKYPKTDIRTSFDLGRNAGLEFASVIVEGLPPAEPKRGRWILDRSGAYCCSECMEPCAGYVMMKPRDKFCKMCGSRNEVTE